MRKGLILLFMISSLICTTLISCNKKVTEVAKENDNRGRVEVTDPVKSNNYENEEKESLESLINNNKFGFTFRNESNGNYAGNMHNDHGKWTSSGGAYTYVQFNDLVIKNDDLYLSEISSMLLPRGKPSFFNYTFPEKRIIKISRDEVELAIKEYPPSLDVNISKNSEKSSANGLIIANNVRVRAEPNLNSEIITVLNKFDEVYLVDETENDMTIENLTFPWYKVKLSEDKYGWVFGGFAKIYFDDEDIERLKIAFAKEGSEYTNQFIPDDNS